jgi:hypothetical protein
VEMKERLLSINRGWLVSWELQGRVNWLTRSTRITGARGTYPRPYICFWKCFGNLKVCWTLQLCYFCPSSFLRLRTILRTNPWDRKYTLQQDNCRRRSWEWSKYESFRESWVSKRSVQERVLWKGCQWRS